MTDTKKQGTPIPPAPQEEPSLNPAALPAYYPPEDAYSPPPYPSNPTPYPVGTAEKDNPAMPYPAPCPYPPGVTVQPLPPAEIGFTKDVQEPTPLEDSALPPVCVEVDGVAMQLSAFEDKIVRRAFIRKVFCVLALQLLVTFSVVCVFTFSKRVKKAVQENLWAYLSSYILFVIVALVLQFSGSIRRRHPWNLLALGLVTLSLSYMVGAVASFHDTTAVLFAMGTTLVIVFGIIIFSIQTRVDFSYCNGLLLVLALDLLMFGLFSCFFYSTILQVLYGALGALLFSVFLAVDAQLVLGREKYALSPEEYVFAALLLYLDIIMIFLYLLILLGGGSSN